MKIIDLKFVIENPTGTYKKFADSLDEYPILGVTYPTHYGYIEGYQSEDGHDLDVFIGNGPLYGTFQVKRDDAPNGVETKMIFGASQSEIDAIRAQYGPVVHKISILSSLNEFFTKLAELKR